MGRKPSSRPTSFDIAYLAGVSQPTVSRALRGSRSISMATRAKIEKIARELNYSVDKNASSLRSQRANTIALLFFEEQSPEESKINPFFLAMLETLTNRCAVRGYDLLISYQRMEDDWHVRYQDSHRADGLILLGYGDYMLYESRLRQLSEQGTQFVRWGSISRETIGTTVGSDNAHGGRLAGEHLLASGRQTIAFIGQADDHYPEFADRYEGLCDAMEAAGITPDKQLLRHAISSENAGYLAAQSLLESRHPFDALFAASDLIAIGAIRAFREAGLKVPEDIAVVGFDDLPAARVTNPPLTTLAQDIAAAGDLLVDTIIAQIEETEAPSPHLPTKLIVRSSSGMG